MGMDAWVHDIKGTVAPLVIEEIKKTNLKNDFVNVDVEGVGDAIRYSISNNGTITKKELPSLALAKSVTHPAVKSKRVSFRNYLKLFATWKSASINDSLSTANVKNYMDDNCVQRYIPKDLDCKCELKSLHYAPQYIINGTNYIITFLLKVCDKPSDDYWPYNDLVMITYSKDGDVIDHKIIARSGDVWSYQIGGALAPLNINVSQRYHVITSGKSATDGFTKSINTQYSIDEKGKISSFN
jgi:hypothetical protein